MCVNLVAIEPNASEKETVTYNVFDANGNLLETLEPGTDLKTIAAIAGKIIVNMSTGDILKEVDGKILMPASDVMVFAPDTMVTYTINGEQFTAVLGSIASYEVTLNKNQALKAEPNIGALASYVVNADGSKTLTYTFKVKEADLAITYAIETVSVEDYRFNTYEVEEEKANLLWLWILIALIVLIGLIALFYNLYINEKLKPNFMLRFITQIVNLFFKACLAVSAVVLWIAQGTTKKGEVNYEEFGMTNPEDLENAENSDETAVAEAVAEEAVAEEVVAEEVVAEEVVAEEAVAEEVVAEEVVAEEVVTEEVVAEEVVTEETATEATEEQN